MLLQSDIRQRCYTLMLHNAVTLSCYTMLLDYRVIQRCYTVMLYNVVTLSCYTTLLHSYYIILLQNMFKLRKCGITPCEPCKVLFNCIYSVLYSSRYVTVLQDLWEVTLWLQYQYLFADVTVSGYSTVP